MVKVTVILRKDQQRPYKLTLNEGSVDLHLYVFMKMVHMNMKYILNTEI